MITQELTIDAPLGPMRAHLAHFDATPQPAVIVLEGIYGYDEEIKRITDVTAAPGFCAIAIDYLRGKDPAKVFNVKDIYDDVAATRDWLNRQPFVHHGKVATLGFGYGGTASFLASTLPGLDASICFYGQNIARPLPGSDKSALDEVTEIRAPLLLIFGGHDELIGPNEIETIRQRLTAKQVPFEIQLYPEVGHSFFREDLGTIATRQIADGWDRVRAFLKRQFA